MVKLTGIAFALIIILILTVTNKTENKDQCYAIEKMPVYDENNNFVRCE